MIVDTDSLDADLPAQITEAESIVSACLDETLGLIKQLGLDIRFHKPIRM